MVHLEKDNYPKGWYNTFNVKKIELCSIEKFGDNVYEVEMPKYFE
jgi:hypothetical protein